MSNVRRRQVPLSTQSACLLLAGRCRARAAIAPWPAFPRLCNVSSTSCHAWSQSPTSRRAVRPVAARARALYTEEESSQTQYVQCPLGTCHLHPSSGTLSSMALASFLPFGFESKFSCGRSEASIESVLCGSALSVLGSSVHLARIPNKCLPRMSTPSNPSIEGMPKRLRLLCTPHVKR